MSLVVTGDAAATTSPPVRPETVVVPSAKLHSTDVNAGALVATQLRSAGSSMPQLVLAPRLTDVKAWYLGCGHHSRRGLRKKSKRKAPEAPAKKLTSVRSEDALPGRKGPPGGRLVWRPYWTNLRW